MSKLIPGSSTGRSTKAPSIPEVRSGNPELDRFALAVKEYIELREGVRGNPYDRVATLRDITPAADTATTTSSTASSSSSTVNTSTDVARVVAAESARLRSEIARTERAMRDAINSFVTHAGDQLTAQAVQALGSAGKYTKTNLADDLASGAATIIAGATSGTAVMKLAPDGTYVLFQHKDANVNGLGAGYSGTIRTAVGITAAGFIAGYNRQSDGAFQPSVVIDSATGNVTILGTLKANSVIEVGAYLGSQTVSSVLSDVSAAYSTASGAYSLAASKLTAQSVYILGADFALKTSGFDAGSGVAITNNGILGRQAGVTKFALDNAGNASFAGDIVTDGDAIFSGVNSANYTVVVGSGTFSVDYSVFGVAATSAAGKVRAGLLGRANSVGSEWNVGVLGTASNGFYNSNSIGVYGAGQYGGWFESGASNASAVVANNTNNGGAVQIIGGTFVYGGVTIGRPDGGTDKYLRNDGQWASVGSIGGGTVTSVSGSGSVSGITLSGTVTTSGSLSLGGALSLTTGQLTATAPGSSYFLSGGGWITVNVVSKLNGATGDVTNAFYANNSIAGTSITVSGSGTNSVTYNFSSTSDRSLKKDIVDIDKGLAFINQLRPVSYLWDTEHMTFAHRTYGFVANEVRDLVQEESSLVYTNQGGVFDGKLAVDYQSYVPILVKAVQELSARVAQLEQVNA